MQRREGMEDSPGGGVPLPKENDDEEEPVLTEGSWLVGLRIGNERPALSKNKDEMEVRPLPAKTTEVINPHVLDENGQLGNLWHEEDPPRGGVHSFEEDDEQVGWLGCKAGARPLLLPDRVHGEVASSPRHGHHCRECRVLKRPARVDT